MERYAEVVLPIHINQLYTYSIPAHLQIHAFCGSRVIVPVKKQKYMGIILQIHDKAPDLARIQPLLEILDTTPLLLPRQIELWWFLKEYYLAAHFEILHTTLPAGLRLERKSFVQLVEPLPDPLPSLTEPQQRMLNFIAEKKFPSLDQLDKIVWGKNSTRLLKELQDLRCIEVQDHLIERTRPKTERFVRLTAEYCTQEAVLNLIDSLKNKTAQIRVLLAIIGILQTKQHALDEWLNLKTVQEKAAVQASVFANLIKANYLEIQVREVSRISPKQFEKEKAFEFTPVQQAAYQAIRSSMLSHNVTLLHGVTGSGKTEIYIQLIRDTLAQGRQVLYLLPEITLTEYMITRIRAHFGNQVAVYHSRLSEAVRTELYVNMRYTPESVKFVLGVRSSLFLPFTDLGLIIVDEEHESSFKQQNPSPRYQARDVAIMLAQIHNAKVLLGSATPSIESYTHARSGKYGFVTLSKRFGEAQQPEFQIIDMRKAYHRKEYEGHFSDQMLEAIRNTVAQQKQVILFQQRRGFAPHVLCTQCGWEAECPHCDVKLTYHRNSQQLRCHYCGFATPMPTSCPACASSVPKLVGLGTQRVEDELRALFPELRIARLDTDTTSHKETLNDILHSFAEGDIDVLVGTQMVAKGLDFNSVHLVGVLDANGLLALPNFRANERAFQLMSQVGGRAGRRTERGIVMIQTTTPDLPIFEWIRTNDYLTFYQNELNERSITLYPPYIRLIIITLEHTDLVLLAKTSEILRDLLVNHLHCKIFGPMIPLIAFIKGRYLRQFVLKISNKSLVSNKKELNEIIQFFRMEHPHIRLSVDVDCY